MTRRWWLSSLVVALCVGCALFPHVPAMEAASKVKPADLFHTSDRCVACHNGMKTKTGEDISIGFEWRGTMMANSARDPYWQGSVRRETIDHPEASAAIQNECSTCHMPMQHLVDKMENRETQVLSRLPLKLNSKADTMAADGVTCSVCHQIKADGLGTPATYVGRVVVAGPEEHVRREYGPFNVNAAHATLMNSSTGGYLPTQSAHIRDAGLCGSCHTLYTKALGPGGKEIGQLPEQMPYLEWLHSSYRDTQTCQDCHMPAVKEPVRISSLFGEEREGVRRHTFVGSNFLLEGMLSAHREELAVTAQPEDFAASSVRNREFLQTQAARVTVDTPHMDADRLMFAVKVENLSGHKLPTAYPSRRAWLHVVVSNAEGKVIFESGRLNADGSIEGNLNDEDPKHFSPHYERITAPGQVQIFEAILGDTSSHVTTGLITATQYLKDNRILPSGFDKQTAVADIAVRGAAAADPAFVGGAATTLYAIPADSTAGPFHVAVELEYQPVGYRWAHNLAAYSADEPQRFVRYYKEAAGRSAIVMAHAEANGH